MDKNTEVAKMIENLILDGIKPYTKTNVGSILLSDIEKLAGAIFALTASIKDQECQQRVEGIKRKIARDLICIEIDLKTGTHILCLRVNGELAAKRYEAIWKEEGI